MSDNTTLSPRCILNKNSVGQLPDFTPLWFDNNFDFYLSIFQLLHRFLVPWIFHNSPELKFVIGGPAMETKQVEGPTEVNNKILSNVVQWSWHFLFIWTHFVWLRYSSVFQHSKVHRMCLSMFGMKLLFSALLYHWFTVVSVDSVWNKLILFSLSVP